MDPLNEVLLRNVDTYTDDDWGLIKSNQDKLNSEEKERFSEQLNPEPQKEEVQEQVEEAKEESKGFDKEELDQYLEDKRKEWDKQGVSQAQQDKAEEDIKEFFKKDELPRDWNHAGTRISAQTIAEIKSHPEEFAKILAPHMIKETEEIKRTITEEQRKKIETTNKEWDGQMEALAKEGKVPPLDTKEGKEVDRQIAAIGLKYNQPDMKSAHDLWAAIPKEAGGGLDMSKARMKQQKRQASMIGGGTGGNGGSNRRTFSQADIHNKSIDQLIEQY